MRIRPTLLLTIFLLVANVCAFAQKKEDERKKEMEAIRNEIWNMKIPAFENRTVPEKYANEPGIIMARYQEIKAGSKNRVKITGLGYAKYRETYFSTIFREQVKINDKATLDEYSEMSYQKYKALARTFSKRTGRATMLGVRIIKPDGTIKDVSTDEEVNIKNERNEKKNKIAIPGLEVGDIIDYFLYEQETEEGYKEEPYSFIFADDKPILFSSIHCEVSPSYAVEYRAMNGAPDFKVKNDEDDNHILDASSDDIAKVPFDLWMSPARQIPILRLNIRVGIKSERKSGGEVYRNPSLDKVLESAKSDLRSGFMNSQIGLMADAVANEIKPMIKRVKKTDDLPKDSIPYYVYYALRYMMFYKVNAGDAINVGVERNYRSPNPKKFLLLLSATLDNFKISNEILLSTSVYGPDEKQVLLGEDFEYLLRTTEGTPIYMSAEGVFTECNYIPSELQGQKSRAVNLAWSPRSIKVVEKESVKIPATTAQMNLQTENLKVSLLENNEQLKIERKTIQKGLMRQGDQRRLLLFEDYYEEERNALGVKESFMEQFADRRKTRGLADEYTSAFAQARKTQKEYFEDEINSMFDQAPKELISYKINNMALRHSNPDFIYSTQFVMDGWVKKGGNNLIVDIGRIIGSQLKLKPTQIERKVDVYMPFPRTFEYNISFEIPQGYKAEGVDQLVTNTHNETSSFISEAKVEGNQVHLKVTKVYATFYEPASNWPKLVEMITAANDFQSKKILLRKE